MGILSEATYNTIRTFDNRNYNEGVVVSMSLLMELWGGLNLHNSYETTPDDYDYFT